MTVVCRSWVAVALLAAACRQPVSPQPPPRQLAASAVTDRVAIYLIAPGDRGRNGKAVGCGDSAVAVEVPLSPAGPALEGALRTLLARRTERDPATGLADPLYASSLALAGIERSASTAVVRLTGYIELGSACDNARLHAQLDETARQFTDLTKVSFLIEGQSFEALVAGTASTLPTGALSAGASQASSTPTSVAVPGGAPTTLTAPPPPATSPDSAPGTPPPPPS